MKVLIQKFSTQFMATDHTSGDLFRPFSEVG